MFHVKHPAKLTDSLRGLTPEPSELQLQALAGYLELLIDWTERIDLVSPGTPETLVKRHFHDAFAVWEKLNERGLFSNGGCIDAGTGAGLPGVILAILSPETKFYLCEPRQKRVVFLQEVRRRLGLKNVTVIGKRLEDVEPSECPGSALMTFRALRPEGSLLDAALELVPRGTVAFLTGASERLVLPHGVKAEEAPYQLAGDSVGRKIILIKSAT